MGTENVIAFIPKFILCIDRQIKDSSLTDDHSENSQNDKRKQDSHLENTPSYKGVKMYQKNNVLGDLLVLCILSTTFACEAWSLCS